LVDPDPRKRCHNLKIENGERCHCVTLAQTTFDPSVSAEKVISERGACLEASS